MGEGDRPHRATSSGRPPPPRHSKRSRAGSGMRTLARRTALRNRAYPPSRRRSRSADRHRNNRRVVMGGSARRAPALEVTASGCPSVSGETGRRSTRRVRSTTASQWSATATPCPDLAPGSALQACLPNRPITPPRRPSPSSVGSREHLRRDRRRRDPRCGCGRRRGPAPRRDRRRMRGSTVLPDPGDAGGLRRWCRSRSSATAESGALCTP